MGKQQHYKLGKWLRHRYNGTLLSEKYDSNEIYIQATDTDRTLMSAASNLAGMFEPTHDETWNPSINWQPIPIHTIPRHLDSVVACKPPCLAFDYLTENLLRTKEFMLLKPRLNAIYDYLTEHAGQPIDSIKAVRELYDTILVQNIYNKTLVFRNTFQPYLYY